MYEIPILFYYFELQHCTAMGYTKDESSLFDKKMTFLALVRISECSNQSNMEHGEILTRARDVIFFYQTTSSHLQYNPLQYNAVAQSNKIK